MILKSKTIRMRLIEEADAEFILKLRLDEKYNIFLSTVKPDLQAQIDWIREYKKDEQAKKQFYFIIERLDGTPCGTYRIYDLTEEYFTIGSWILNEDKTRYAAIESTMLTAKFGFENLGYKKVRFETMKNNKTTINFIRGAGGIDIGEDETFYYFEVNEFVYNIMYKLGVSFLE